MNAVEKNDKFIADHWDLYPECIQKHIKNTKRLEELNWERHDLSQQLESNLKSIDRLLRILDETNLPLDGLKRMVVEYDNQVSRINKRLLEFPDLKELANETDEFEKEGIRLGWTNWRGTGGLHWINKDVIQDDYK